jgi:hypothetical protein
LTHAAIFKAIDYLSHMNFLDKNMKLENLLLMWKFQFIRPSAKVIPISLNLKSHSFQKILFERIKKQAYLSKKYTYLKLKFP